MTFTHIQTSRLYIFITHSSILVFRSLRGVLYTTPNKTDHHDITEILLKMALNTIKLKQTISGIIRNITSVLICRPPPNIIHLVCFIQYLKSIISLRMLSSVPVCLKFCQDRRMINEIKTHIDLFIFFVKTKVNKNVKQTYPYL